MSSKYCPDCSRVNSVTRYVPSFCMWCGRALDDMPLLPPYTEWGCNAVEYAERCKKEYENNAVPLKVGENGQLKLFG